MPIKIPNDLPAGPILAKEGVNLIKETDAIRQDIRPLRIALLNLMPNKIRTETQFARLTGSTPLQVELTLLHTGSYKSKNTPERHLLDFYKTWEQVRDEKFDGLIITGAPVETMPFEEVDYWEELTRIIDWTQTNVFHTMYICWGAQAALYHWYGVPKYELEQKMFGVFRQHVVYRQSPQLIGINDEFSIPVSRHTEVRSADIPQRPGLNILAESPDSGLCLVEDLPRRAVYMFNHVEYDASTLKDEYDRDVAAGMPIQVPANYYPKDDPSQPPINRWRSYAHLLFGNWINEIYQHAPFDISEIGRGAPSLDRPSLQRPAVKKAG